MAINSNFTIDCISNTKSINKDFLKQYQLFIQLDYPPYPWEKEAQMLLKIILKMAAVDGSVFITADERYLGLVYFLNVLSVTVSLFTYR